MKLQIFTVYDAKTHAYHQPMFFTNQPVALREFTIACNNPESYLCKSPQDYSLFHLGEWDDDTATITQLPAPHCLGIAATFKKESQS